MTLSDRIIRTSFDFAANILQSFLNNENTAKLRKRLDTAEQNTLGRHLADCMDRNNVDFIPYFESHDLKHVLLDYEMKPLDEIRLQAYLLGNGNVTVITLLIFFFGFVLKPFGIITFYYDFLRGRSNPSLRSLTVQATADQDFHSLRRKYAPTVKHSTTPIGIQHLLHPQFLSLSVMAAGVFGLFWCLPYLYSTNMNDVIGAGPPFIAAAVLVAGGLLSYTRATIKLSIKT